MNCWPVRLRLLTSGCLRFASILQALAYRMGYLHTAMSPNHWFARSALSDTACVSHRIFLGQFRCQGCVEKFAVLSPCTLSRAKP